MKSRKHAAVAAALAGLLGGTAARLNAQSSPASNSMLRNSFTASQDTPKESKPAKTKVEKHACKGMNSCKGKGGCSTGDNGCKAKNSCKGKGGCATDGSNKK